MRTDVFPDLNMPIIYVAQAYGGMDSAQMEGLITNYYEYAFLYMNGIDHVETKNIQNLALVKLYFHPGTDMAQAMAEAAIYANRAKAYFPPGTVTPFILRLDASSVPVSYLVLSSETRSISELSDLMLFRVRPILASLPGASAPQPFGGSLRTIVVNLDPEQLADVQPVAAGSGRGPEPGQHHHALRQCPHPGPDADRLGQLDRGRSQGPGQHPASSRGRASICATSGTVEDASDIPLGWALVNGRRSIYMPIVKTADASTLTVVNELKDNMERMRSRPARGRQAHPGVRPVALRHQRRRRRGRGVGHRRHPDRPDGAAVPARLAQRDRRRAHHSAGADGRGDRTVDGGADAST